jgi:nucleoside-diphosphate-sugar epimerase
MLLKDKITINKPSIIITGATGSVGSVLIPLLLENSYQVFVIGRNAPDPEKFIWAKYVKFFQADILRGEFPLIPQGNYWLVHFAWEGLPNYHSLHHIDLNLIGSYQFIKASIPWGVTKILVAGTCFEYGLQNGELSANSKLEPVCAYGIAKFQLHQQLSLLLSNSEVKLQWPRIFYLLSSTPSRNSLFHQISIALKNNDKEFDLTLGEQLRDYLTMDSATSQIFTLLTSDRSGAFNICSGEPISVRRIIEDYVESTGKCIKLNFGKIPYNNYEPLAFWGKRYF